MTRLKLIGLITAALLLMAFLSGTTLFAIQHGLAWYEMRTHFQQCKSLCLVTTKFYTDHRTDNPLPVASFDTLRQGGYISEKLISQLTRDSGVYCFFTPPSANPHEPLVGYFSKKDIIVFSVGGNATVSRYDATAP